MIPIFLCDDELFWIRQLEDAIFSYQVGSDWELKLACKTTSPRTLLEYLQVHKPSNGIYFLDVHFPSEMSGLELAVEIRKLDPHATLVFITTKEEMVMETFRLKLEALDYIIKDTTDWLENVEACLKHLETSFLQSPSPYKDTLTLKQGNLYKTIPLQDICYIDSVFRSHRICIHTISGFLSFPLSLTTVQGMLNENFFKCSRTCIINLRHIKEWRPRERKIVLSDNFVCECATRECARLTTLMESQVTT